MKTLVGMLAAVLLSGQSVLAQNVAGVKTFQEAYKDYFSMGVAVNQRNITDSMQRALVVKEFNSITSENDFKPGSLQPQEGRFTWERADRVANFCREHGIRLRGHCLVWHNQTTNWMFYDEKGELVTKEVLFERMRTHIHTVVKRYADIIYCWDVVNEVITDDGGAKHPYRESLYYKIAGDEFIKKAFIYAREADPDALLFINDYNECNPKKRDRICEVVRSMKAEGVPIDGIGMQGHYNIYGPSEQEMEAALAKYSEVVDHIHMTELDIRVNTQMGGQLRFDRGEGNQITGEQRERQEQQYATLFRLLRKYSDKVECVTFWNLSDRDSWLGAGNYPLPFDAEYRPKNVYRIINGFEP